MPRPVRPWFRVYVEICGDRKMKRLTPAQRWLWVALMAAARESPTPGRLLIAEGVPMTVDELADHADMKLRDVQPALDAMVRLGMVVMDGDVIVAKNWDARQFESDNVTARTAAHRERSKEHPDEQRKNVPTNVRRNAPDTDTETDTEQKTSSSEPRKRGTRIDPEWKPSVELVAWQRESGISDLLARRELPKFIDYWTGRAGRDAVKLDWNATWRNRLRDLQEREQKAAAPSPTARVREW